MFRQRLILLRQLILVQLTLEDCKERMSVMKQKIILVINELSPPNQAPLVSFASHPHYKSISYWNVNK